MSEVCATAKIKDEEGNLVEEKTACVEYDFGDSIQDAIEKFGEDVVFSNFKQAATISLQSRIRSWVQAGKEGDDLQEEASNWKPGMRTVSRKSPTEKLKDLLAGKSPEEIAALLQEAGIAA